MCVCACSTVVLSCTSLLMHVCEMEREGEKEGESERKRERVCLSVCVGLLRSSPFVQFCASVVVYVCV